MTLRRCLREPIPEIETAAQRLNDAVSAHLAGRHDEADALLRQADDRTVWEWLDSVWGKASAYNVPRRIVSDPPVLSKELRGTPRNPTTETKRRVHERDGHYCRCCGIPVIRGDIRKAIRMCYGDAVPWDGTNAGQHAAFSACWAQYDHVLPHARGGSSDIENVYLTCAACNYGRGPYLLDEFDLLHPELIPKRTGDWDGLERFR